MLVNISLLECKKKELHTSSSPSGYPALNFLPISTYNLGGSAGPGMFPNKISKLQWVQQRVIAVLYLCLGRADSEKSQWVIPAFALSSLCSTRAEMLEHIMLISCESLHGRWIFLVKNNSCIFWYKSGGKSKIIWFEETKI